MEKVFERGDEHNLRITDPSILRVACFEISPRQISIPSRIYNGIFDADLRGTEQRGLQKGAFRVSKNNIENRKFQKRGCSKV